MFSPNLNIEKTRSELRSTGKPDDSSRWYRGTRGCAEGLSCHRRDTSKPDDSRRLSRRSPQPVEGAKGEDWGKGPFPDENHMDEQRRDLASM